MSLTKDAPVNSISRSEREVIIISLVALAIIMMNFHTSLSPMDRSSIVKLSSELNYTIDQVDAIGIYRTCHPTAAAFFPLMHGTFSGIKYN